MRSAALQMLASGLSSGDTSANDSSSSISSRGGGGVVRGLLQSIRAGFSTDSSSRRSNRNGLTDGLSNVRSTQGQHVHATGAEICNLTTRKLEVEETCLEWLSSGVSELIGSSESSKDKGFSEVCATPLALDVGSNCSGSQPGSFETSRRVSLEASRNTGILAGNAAICVGSRSSGSNFGNLGVSSLKSVATISLTTGPGPASHLLQPPLYNVAKAPTEPVQGASPAAADPGTGALDQKDVERPRSEDPFPATSNRVSATTSANSAKNIRCKTSYHRPGFVAALTGGAAATNPALLQDSSPFEPGSYDYSNLNNTTAAAADFDQLPGIGGEAVATGGHSHAVSNLSRSLSSVDTQQHEQDQQQGHCDFVAGNALSAVAVTQAVHRLQLRQQHEKAAARLPRSSIPHQHPISSVGLHQYLSHQGHHQAHYDCRDVPAVASIHRVLSVASADTTAPPRPVSFDEAGVILSQPQAPQLYSQVHQSPARHMNLGARHSRSTSSSFMFLANQAGTGARAQVDVAVCGEARKLVGRADKSDDAGDVGVLDDWLNHVPGVSRGGLLHSSRLEWEGRNSVSFTEGHMSAEDRLQAMFGNAVSVEDDAVSYLQQLLIPDIPSTASADLHYSSTSTWVPSAISMAYGSSGGAASTTGLSAIGGLRGLMPSPGCSGYGDSLGSRPPLAPTGVPTVVGTRAQHASAHVHPQYADRKRRPSNAGSSSGAGSRLSSGVLNCQTSPVQLASARSFTGAPSSTTGSMISSSYVPTELPDSASLHGEKTAAQLVEKLRELYASPFSDAETPPPRATSFQKTSGGSPCSCEHDTTTAADGVQQQREELVAALWRLVRTKDSDAVSYLLAMDVGSRANRKIAKVIKEMRSCVYVNMW